MTTGAGGPRLPGDASLSDSQRRRSLIVIIASSGVAGLTLGMILPLISLALDAVGESTGVIGTVAAASPLGILVCSPFVPRIIGRFGVLRALVLALALDVAVILCLPLAITPWLWLPLCFLTGLASGVHWIATETWVLAAAGPARRGRAVALYMMVLAGGFALGPLVIGFVGVVGWLPYVTVAGCMALAGLPLMLARGCVPQLPPREPAAFSTAFRTAPMILAAALMAGFIDTAVIALLPLYGLNRGLGQAEAVFLLSAMLMGTMVLQLPIGWLADRLDSRRLIIAFAVVFMVAPLLVPQVLAVSAWQWPLLIIWGACSVGVYTLALALLGERFSQGALAGANAAMVAVYTLGSVTGPFLCGLAMDLWGTEALMPTLSAAAGIFLLFAAYRTFVRARPAGG